MRRRPKSPPRNSPRYGDDYSERDRPERETNPGDRPAAKPSPLAAFFNATAIAVLVGVFVVGIGIGVAFSSATSSPTGSLATRYDLDKVAPSPNLCVQFGASAIAMDVRAFVTLNPLAVYISQPKTQPGCVLRSSNFSILEQRNLVTPQQVRDCRQRLNTFGFIGPIDDRASGAPQISCVYQNDAAQNLFLDQPGSGIAPSETERF